MTDIFVAIEENAARYPGSLAFISPNAVLSYRDLAFSIRNIATKALSLGIEPGSVVCVRSRNPNVTTLTHLGLMKAGMTVDIADSPSAYVSHDIVFDALLTDGGLPAGQPIQAKRQVQLSADWAQTHPASDKAIGDAPYGALFASSGSTGDNKLYFASKQAIEHRVQVKAGEAYFAGFARYMSLMLASSAISFIDMLITLTKGGQVIRLGSFSVEQALDAVTFYKPNYVTATPFAVSSVLELMRKTPRQFEKIEHLFVGGAYCPIDLLNEANSVLANNVTYAYGLTEIGVISMSPIEEIGNKKGNVGKPVPGMIIEALDQSGDPLPIGEVGEIRIKPPAGSVLDSYRNNSRTPLLDGDWFYPGDSGFIDSDGYLRIVGRLKNVINQGGNKYNPEQVEAALLEMEGIDDAAVVSVAGTSGYDDITALICSSREFKPDQVNKFLASRKYPFEIAAIQHVASIPRNENGKIRRANLADLVRTAS